MHYSDKAGDVLMQVIDLKIWLHTDARDTDIKP
jgi:hypothetical protein